ncbi:hypothetical protein [Glaciecola sp. KUL10]|uniref:hypothetical protein n=1 Tax=Glaciecola sp. (strain KUL10) TaxID=2161813 RepID=UPI000D786830|nr:hypothetical protein [Glaciecola sp. KUL10]GBL06334.1 hypothetical protein KUL10_36770 [Glaciecola sp. KUL10]
MKIPVLCSQCTSHTPDIQEINKHSRSIHVTDSIVYRLECPKGHIEFLVLKHFAHEILFEIGAQAIEDGYYREAISSFTSSLERFYEFFIRITCEFDRVDKDEFNKAWRTISSLSERQLGAYIFRYLSHFGQAPAAPNNKIKTLRNKVIHKGYIPSRNEALNYGERILNEIMPILLELRDKNEFSFSTYCNEYLWDIYQNTVSENKGYQVSQSDNPFILNWNRLNFECSGEKINLDKRLKQRPKCYSVANI